MKLLRFAIPLLIIISGFFIVSAIYEKSCFQPIVYSIGSFDNNFKISQDSFLVILERAEIQWEEILGKDIFQYKEDGDFKINLIFGEEQKNIEKGDDLLSELDFLQKNIEKHEQEYNKLTNKYKTLSTDYKIKLAIYEKDVLSWNEQGGAPRDIYEKLLIRKKELDDYFAEIQAVQKKVNAIVITNNKEINKYNNQVSSYNNIFSDEREFEAGDTNTYNQINIHSFKNEQELYTILVHEFGHVLGLGHLNNKNSVMYYLLNDENNTGVLSDEDIQEVKNICRIR